ncbi:MAG: hypothetical protein CBC13_06430 [Planctomycetia bacterium TMED53]|nr:MAG: hypothetical protein CBC13_06430 [Planctomycetia bacterium TMED53]
MTRKLNDNVGIHLGFATSGNTPSQFDAVSVPHGGFVVGAQYLTDNGFSLGIQSDGIANEPMITLGIDDPKWFLTIFEIMIGVLLSDDDEADRSSNHL